MGQSWPLFVYFHSFLITISIQIEKSTDGVLGIWTRGRRMVGPDETTQLWQPPLSFSLPNCLSLSLFICLSPNLSLSLSLFVCLSLPLSISPFISHQPVSIFFSPFPLVSLPLSLSFFNSISLFSTMCLAGAKINYSWLGWKKLYQTSLWANPSDLFCSNLKWERRKLWTRTKRNKEEEAIKVSNR